MVNDIKALGIYRISYTICPTDANIDWKQCLMKTRHAAPYKKQLEEKMFTRKYTAKCQGLGHQGLSNEVLLVARNDVSIELQLLELIQPLPDRSQVKITCLETVTDNDTAKTIEGDTNEN